MEWRGARHRAYFEGRTEGHADRDVGLRKSGCHGGQTPRSLAVMGPPQGRECWRVSGQSLLESELHGERTVDKFPQGPCSLGRHM